MTDGNPEVSVLIPTYNAGREFEAVLETISGQKTDFEYEVLIVDSGSSDGTLELAHRHLARLLPVPKSEFSHGGTRNRGVSEARGKYVVMTVQDALPANEVWLGKLVENLAADERVAGAYSRQIPRSDCNPFSRHALEGHFTNRPERVEQEILGPGHYESLTPFERLELITFDNVSACIRRSVWEEHPFAPISFGEDIEWSERVLKAGFKIVYEPESAVVHSHNRPAFYEMKRAYATHKLLSGMVGLRSLPTFEAFRLGVLPTVRQRRKLAAGGGPRLQAQAITRSLGDLTGTYLGGLAGAGESPAFRFLDRWLGRGV